MGWKFGGVGKWGGEILPEVKRRVGQVMKVWAAHVKSLGIKPSQIAILLVDEPGGGQLDQLIVGWAEAIKAAVPEFTLFIDPCHQLSQLTDPTTQRVFGLMDIICPGRGYRWMLKDEAAIRQYAKYYGDLRQKGKQLGFYSCAQNASEACAIRYYRLQQWDCWKAQATWTGFWSYSDTRGNSPWNQLPGGKDRNWSPVYIDSTSVTDGKHWLAIFEGVQDYEYLRMLRDRVAELREAGRRDETIAAAEKLLAELPDQVIAAAQAGDIDAWDAGRLRVLDMLEALQK